MYKCYTKDTAYSEEYCNSKYVGTRSKELQISYLDQRNRNIGMFPVCVLSSYLSVTSRERTVKRVREDTHSRSLKDLLI